MFAEKAFSPPAGTAGPAEHSGIDYRQLILQDQPTIRHVVRRIARRSGLSHDEELDFLGALHVRLIEDNYRVYRRFAGRSSMATYLTVVATRLLIDTRNRAWGRFRASAQARRLGEVATTFERLRSCDGYTTDEAAAELSVRYPGIGESQIHAIQMRLPAAKPRRRPAPVDHAVDSSASSPERPLMTLQQSAHARQVEAVLRAAIARLAPEDRRLLRLRFRDGVKVVDIATAMGMKQRELYARFDRILAGLRRSLEAGDITRATSAGILGANEIQINGALEDSGVFLRQSA